MGAGVVIEKGFQPGGDNLRKQGIRLESLAIVDSMDEEKGTIVFGMTSSEKKSHYF